MRNRIHNAFFNFGTSKAGIRMNNAFSHHGMSSLAGRRGFRPGVIGGLGLGAAYGAKKTYESIQNHQYGSAALRGAMSAAAGMGAYKYMRNPAALSQHMGIVGGSLRNAMRGQFGKFRF